jgi:hypothetical protein
VSVAKDRVGERPERRAGDSRKEDKDWEFAVVNLMMAA